MSEIPQTGTLNVPTEHTTGTPIMSARGLVKRYGNVTAIDGADFDLYPGEILAVIGDNGAGKSSLIKALAGAVIPDQGEIRLDGEPVHFKSPLEARRAGIETVYQDLAVAPAMDIATNIFLGREKRRAGPLGSVLRMVDKRGMKKEAQQHMADLKIGIRSMGQAVETLSGGQRQVLVDRLDPRPARLEGRLEVHRLAVEPDLTLVGDHRAGQRLDQAGLAGAIVPDHRQDLAGVELEVRPVDRRHVAVALHQAARRHDRRALRVLRRDVQGPGRGDLAHSARLRANWSTDTARMTRMPVKRVT